MAFFNRSMMLLYCWIILASFLAIIEDVRGDDCPLQVSDCNCEGYKGGYDYWCPDHYDHDYRIHLKSGQFFVICNPDKDLDSTHFLLQMRSFNLSRNFESLFIQNCPMLEESYSKVLQSLNMKSVKEIVLKNGVSKQKLVADQFKDIQGLDTLKIQSIQFSTVDSNTFRGLDNLQVLSLISNGITDIPSELFQSLTSLRHLEIMERTLTSISSNLLSRLSSLKYLFIDMSSMENIEENTFDSLENLESLTLNRMKLTEIPVNLLRNTRNLKNITIRGKGFESATKGFFNNTKLEHFEWSLYPCSESQCNLQLNPFLNNVNTLKKFSFGKSHKVKTNFDPEFFSGCSGLKFITISSAGLQTIPILKDTKHLKVLKLDKNDLSQSPNDIFYELSNLEELYLDHNNLDYLKSASFNGLRKLKILSITNNKITKLDRQVFHPLIKLEDLRLSNNRIEFNDSNMPNWRSLVNLVSLDLSYNNIGISQIPTEWTTNWLSLKTINISQNHFGPVLKATDLYFQHQHQLNLDISFNNISLVDFTDIQNSFITTSSNKAQILMEGNPINCDCKSLDLFNFLMKRTLNKIILSWFEIKDAQCYQPKEYHEINLKSLESDDLYCSFPSEQFQTSCPNSCQCKAIPSFNVSSINCQGTQMSKYPKFAPNLPNAINIDLNLCDNQIKKLKKKNLKQMKNYESIVNLHLCNNALKTVEQKQLPPNLKGLDLKGNNITYFDSDTLEFFKKLSWLNLNENNFPCSCDSKPLFIFLQSYRELIRDLKNLTITCNEVTRPILDWNLNDICYDIDSILIPILFSIIIAILVIGIICLYYRRRLKIWMYSKDFFRKFCFIEDQEDLMYDAFISYSSEDSEFVEENLVPRLESASHQDIQYKCLVHVRDFNVGVPIVEQITNAVENSMRTIIVLSKQFVKSDWYQHEFSAAHTRKKVIVVIYGEIPTEEEMGPLMWQYIKTNTYLSHDDPWFWDKLRYALPHRGRKLKRTGIHDEIRLIDANHSSQNDSSQANRKISNSMHTVNS